MSSSLPSRIFLASPFLWPVTVYHSIPLVILNSFLFSCCLYSTSTSSIRCPVNLLFGHFCSEREENGLFVPTASLSRLTLVPAHPRSQLERRVKWPELEADSWSPSSVGTHGALLLLPLYALMVSCLITIENFVFFTFF